MNNLSARMKEDILNQTSADPRIEIQMTFTLIVLDTNASGFNSSCKKYFKSAMKITPSFLLDVVQPTVDVYTDLYLIIAWYRSHHWKYAISMTFPLLLHFSSTTYKWAQLEKNRNKRWTWIPLVLQFWPQWKALSIMKLDWKNDSNTEAKMKELKREVAPGEPFLEAFPSMMILLIIVLLATHDTRFRDYCINNPEDEECKINKNGVIDNAPEYCKKYPDDNQCAVFEGFDGSSLLALTIWKYVYTISLGIIKFFQNGPYFFHEQCFN